MVGRQSAGHLETALDPGEVVELPHQAGVEGSVHVDGEDEGEVEERGMVASSYVNVI